jgi:hypothetical protein
MLDAPKQEQEDHLRLGLLPSLKDKLLGSMNASSSLQAVGSKKKEKGSLLAINKNTTHHIKSTPTSTSKSTQSPFSALTGTIKNGRYVGFLNNDSDDLIEEMNTHPPNGTQLRQHHHHFQDILLDDDSRRAEYFNSEDNSRTSLPPPNNPQSRGGITQKMEFDWDQQRKQRWDAVDRLFFVRKKIISFLVLNYFIGDTL